MQPLHGKKKTTRRAVRKLTHTNSATTSGRTYLNCEKITECLPNISGNTVHKKRIPSDEQSDAFIQRKNKCLVLISSKSIGNRGERCVCLSAHAHSAATTPFMVNFVSYATLRICFKILCSLYIRSKQATTYRTMHLIHYFKNSWFRVRFEQASTRMQPASIIHRKKIHPWFFISKFCLLEHRKESFCFVWCLAASKFPMNCSWLHSCFSCLSYPRTTKFRSLFRLYLRSPKTATCSVPIYCSREHYCIAFCEDLPLVWIIKP